MRLPVITVAIAMLGGMAPVSAQTGEYCAFEIDVRSPNGAPSPGQIVVGEDSSGEEFGRATTDQQGVARLCDSPHGLAEFTVGGNMCGATTVRYVNAVWPQTRRLVMTYERCVGPDYYAPGNCHLLVRLRDPQKAPVSGATLKVRAGGGLVEGDHLVSDQFGRLFLRIRYGETFEGLLSKDGFAPWFFSQACRRGENPSPDRTITLEKISAKP